MIDEDLPPKRGDAAGQLSQESLDSYSQHELTARIRLLESEIDRVKAHFSRVAEHRKAADALFSPRETD
ncbi:DUF1192 domain-containing protein [Altericroceibacterium endophyticum]|uniref:DUF1192 family protein n=1 Tax=Altericroceibacterium endophyticum TaxID=1808508 RepID=A0A6I4T755_9SPHN|nr:DUF1192 domain-containing protein [Altericroceibacterium endophyticum]MXO65680.1 DUF1192 family protein [Altericroceibacterium endophyticum]